MSARAKLVSFLFVMFGEDERRTMYSYTVSNTDPRYPAVLDFLKNMECLELRPDTMGLPDFFLKEKYHHLMDRSEPDYKQELIACAGSSADISELLPTGESFSLSIYPLDVPEEVP